MPSRTEVYTHTTVPRAVAQKKQKSQLQEPLDDRSFSANIMFDRRVVRGNTYAAHPVAEPTLPPPRNTSKRTASGRAMVQTPEAVEGRRHIVVQTDQYLEELTDAVAETEISTQTDPFLDRPVTPLFVPAKTGIDNTTQIEEGDLFDFDFEVEPLLEVVVGKVLEQGLLEVLEEEELAAMRAHQLHFEQVRNAELAAVQRMEAAERRKLEEKERRLAQARAVAAEQAAQRQRVAAATFARAYLKGIMSTVVGRLYDSSHFYDPVEREVRDTFLPWLRAEAAARVDTLRTARAVTERLALLAVEKARELQAAAEAAAAEAARIAAEQAEKAALAKKQAEAKEEADLRANATAVLANLVETEAVTEEQVTQIRQDLEAKEAAAAADAAAPASQEEAPESEPAEQAEEAEPAEKPAVVIPDADVLFAMLSRAVVTRDAARKALGAVTAPQPATV